MDHQTASFIARGGVTMFTQSWRPVGTPRALVVVVHGYGEHSGRYGHVAEALVDAGYAVAALDQRGHGRSGGPRGLVTDIAELSADLALFREEIARGDDEELPQVLLGHSMGGAVVLEHVQGAHDPLAAVVLSGPYVRNAADVALPLRVLAPVIGRVLPTIPTQKVPPEAVSRDPEVVAAYEADPLVFHAAIPAGTGGMLLGLEARLMARMSAVTEPTLVMHGADDRLAAVQGSRDLVGRLGGPAELKVYDGLYHEIFNEPEQKDVLADLVGWLDATLG